MMKVQCFFILKIAEVQKFIDVDTLSKDALLATSWAQDTALATPVALVQLKEGGDRWCESDISGPRCRQKRIFGQDIKLYDLMDFSNF